MLLFEPWGVVGDEINHCQQLVAKRLIIVKEVPIWFG